jgi:uncharacterized membrane protein
MADAAAPSRRTALTLINVGANLAFLALYLTPIVIFDWGRVSAALAAAHAPALDVIASERALVLVHLVAVVAALPIGGFLLVGHKGVRLHRLLGWSWVALIGVGAVTSVFLREIAVGPLATGGFTVFHIITAVTLLVLPLGILAARTHRVRWHAALMIYLLINVVLAAGLFALYPGFSERLLPRAFYEQSGAE